MEINLKNFFWINKWKVNDKKILKQNLKTKVLKNFWFNKSEFKTKICYYYCIYFYCEVLNVSAKISHIKTKLYNAKNIRIKCLYYLFNSFIDIIDKKNNK